MARNWETSASAGDRLNSKPLTRIRHPDGSVTLHYHTDNFRMDLGWSYKKSCATSFWRNGTDRAIVTTRSGNQYGVGDGLVINREQERAYELPGGGRDLPTIFIGHTWLFWDSNDPVETIELRYKAGGVPSDTDTRRPNPFPLLEPALRFGHTFFDHIVQYPRF